MSQIPFLSPNQRCQSVQGNSNHRCNFLACCKMVKQNNCHSRWLYDVHIDAKSASLQPSSIEANVLYSYAGRSQAWTKPINQQMDELTKHTSIKWMVNDWLSCGFTPHSTQNRYPSKTLGLVWKKLNLTQKAHIRQSKEMYYNTK